MYTDAELREVEKNTYSVMSPQDMIEMVTVLFPHMNVTDKKAILSDIHHLQPEKFKQAYPSFLKLLSEKERKEIETTFR